jgi:hypothetical protein
MTAKTVGEARPAITATNIAAIVFFLLGLRFTTCYSKTAERLKKNARRSHDAVIRVYDDAGNVIEMQEHKGDFKEW